MNLQHIKSIALDGGGVKGFSFIGVIKYLEEKNILKNIKHVIGSSVGSIFAASIACGMNSGDMKNIIRNENFEDLKDDTWGYVFDIIRVYNHYGFCKGDAMYDFCGKILDYSTNNADITFLELFEKTHIELVITGTNLNKCKTEFFSYKTRPEMKVRLAMRISASIPLFFKAIDMDGDIYVDGGLLNSYPIWYFDQQHMYQSSIGFKLIGDSEHKKDETVECDRKDIKNLKNYMVSMIDAMLLQIEKGHIKKDYWNRTILINTGNVQATDFKLNNEKMEWLIKQGYDACKKRIN